MGGTDSDEVLMRTFGERRRNPTASSVPIRLAELIQETASARHCCWRRRYLADPFKESRAESPQTSLPSSMGASEAAALSTNSPAVQLYRVPP